MFCSSSPVVAVVYLAYLKAKNTPTTNPGIAIIAGKCVIIDIKSARIPHTKEAVINIKIPDFVVARP